MRRIRYSVAMSLDGYIAGTNGEIDWIVTDPEIDFAAILNEFDTLLVGRRTFEIMDRAGRITMPGMKTIVLSRTLQQQNYPAIGIMGENTETAVDDLRRKPGKDIWLFGGGSLFRSLAEAGLVDMVEVTVSPVLLGAGIPLLPMPSERIGLRLTAHKVYKTGIISLKYGVVKSGD